jgi:CRP/FNR family cyclic AMP-dependent transcriptional regulator
LEDAELMIIPATDFLQLINNDHQVSKQFIKLLTKNVLENEEKLLAIAYQSLRKKVALGLMEVLDKFKTVPSLKPELIISRQDLSHIVGVATESLVRTLSDFKAEKLIELKEGKIIILEENKLRNFLH